MDAEQDALANPFGMDEDCRNCPALCETRSRVVHGYGDVGADFVVIGEGPDAGADRTGVPFTGEAERPILEILAGFGFCESPGSDEPDLDGAYLTYLTRCRHPDRPATEEERRNCEGYLTAEVRMINPEVIVPVGQRALSALAFEYTTRSADDLDVEAEHARPLRGRGFELLPTLHPTEADAGDVTAFREALGDLLDRDYRQTKGRRGR